MATVPLGDFGEPYRMAIDDARSLVVVGTYSSPMTIIRVNEGRRMTADRPREAAPYRVTACGDGRHWLTSNSQTLRLWDGSTAWELGRWEFPGEWICGVEASADGKRVLVLTEAADADSREGNGTPYLRRDALARVFDLPTMQELARTRIGLGGQMFGLHAEADRPARWVVSHSDEQGHAAEAEVTFDGKELRAVRHELDFGNVATGLGFHLGRRSLPRRSAAVAATGFDYTDRITGGGRSPIPVAIRVVSADPALRRLTPPADRSGLPYFDAKRWLIHAFGPNLPGIALDASDLNGTAAGSSWPDLGDNPVAVPGGRFFAAESGDGFRLVEATTGLVRQTVFPRGPGVESVAAATERQVSTIGHDGNVTLWPIWRPVAASDRSGDPAAWYAKLMSEDGLEVQSAVEQMIADPTRTVPWLALNLPMRRAATDPGLIAKAVEALAATAPEGAKAASRAVTRFGPPALPHIREALHTLPALKDGEQTGAAALRLEDAAALIRHASRPGNDRESLRYVRVVEALEQINTTESRKLLKQLAERGANPVLAFEAQVALTP